MIGTKPDIASIALSVILAVAALSAIATEIGVFQPPSLEGYGYDKEWKTDINKDNVKETTVVQRGF